MASQVRPNAPPPRPESLRTLTTILDELRCLVAQMRTATTTTDVGMVEQSVLGTVGTFVEDCMDAPLSGVHCGAGVDLQIPSIYSCHGLAQPTTPWHAAAKMRITELREAIKVVKAAQEALCAPGVNPTLATATRNGLDKMLLRLKDYTSEYNAPKITKTALQVFDRYVIRVVLILAFCL